MKVEGVVCMASFLSNDVSYLAFGGGVKCPCSSLYCFCVARTVVVVLVGLSLVLVVVGLVSDVVGLVLDVVSLVLDIVGLFLIVFGAVVVVVDFFCLLNNATFGETPASVTVMGGGDFGVVGW